MTENLSSAIREFNVSIQTYGGSKLISIEVDETTASKLRKEFDLILKYASNLLQLPHNCVLFDGILIIAPKNFTWR